MLLVTKAMAYIHTSAESAIQRQYIHQKVDYQLVTPVTYREFLLLFRKIAAKIWQEEMVSRLGFFL